MAPQGGGAIKKLAGKPSLSARLRTYFLTGILVTAPVSITLWLSWKVVSLIDSRIRPLIPPQWNPENYLPFALPGIGILVAFVALTVIGVLTKGYLGHLITAATQGLVARLPVVNSVYSWTRQVFETVLSQKSNAFREVVLVEYPCRGSWAVGFITGETKGEVQNVTSETVYNVFVPATPNPTTGFLLFIPGRDIRHLDMTVEEGIKLVISGGIVTPQEGQIKPSSKWAESTMAAAGDARVRRTEKLKARGLADPDSKANRIGLVARLRNYFFTGTLVTAPIGITIWLAWEFVGFVDGKVTPLLPPRWNPETYLPFGLPGLGVVVAVVGLMLVGFLTAGVVGRTLVRTGERILDSLPVIRGIYSAVKQVFETIFKEQSTAFRDVVMIEYPRPESWAIGFLTGNATGQVRDNTKEQSVNVFLPTTPNPTSGFLLFIPEEKTTRLSMTVEQGIKMVVSGGIVTPEDPDAPEAADGTEPPLQRESA